MNMAKLGALGAVGAAIGVLLIYLFLVWVTRSQTLTGGMDPIQQTVTWIATAIPALLIAAANLAIARQLWASGNGKRFSY
ncbi:MAG: hypothetical protein ACJ79S_19290 [Gemmatimonadaceae bacterium]